MCFVLIGVSQPGLTTSVQAARRQAGASVQGEDENCKLYYEGIF